MKDKILDKILEMLECPFMCPFIVILWLLYFTCVLLFIGGMGFTILQFLKFIIH